MNLTKDVECINCGRIMKPGGAYHGPEFSQFRSCECGLNIILFTKNKKRNYSLCSELKEEYK